MVGIFLAWDRGSLYEGCDSGLWGGSHTPAYICEGVGACAGGRSGGPAHHDAHDGRAVARDGKAVGGYVQASTAKPSRINDVVVTPATV